LLLAYYADDFTGSTDALEALTAAGVDTALFVEPPNAEMLRRYPHVQAVGVAGNSRMMSPAEMDAALPAAFQVLQIHRPSIVHYKVCSTFDSSPNTGSIGRAIELGQRVFANRFTPIVVGVPPLQRFCVFGNLFARSGLSSQPFRLDRHPSMRHHPVTSMDEADLRVHLSRQTSRPIELLDVLALDGEYEAARGELDRLTSAAGRAVLFDCLTDDHLALIGRLISEAQSEERKPLFAVGSSAIEYALTKHWKASGMQPGPHRTRLESVDAVDRTVVVSGSRSPVTKRQIGWALKNGFEEVRVEVTKLPSTAGDETEGVVNRILSLLGRGKSVVLHTTKAPSPCPLPEGEGSNMTDSRNGAGVNDRPLVAENGRRLGVALGQILRDVVRASAVRRVAVAGGDTSGYVARTMGIESLEMAGPLQPGAPVCIARSQDPAIEGLEVVFKGGQVGYDDFFGTLLRGQSPVH
jgi:uncharacterized protein YgbK (DUF1537 family)